MPLPFRKITKRFVISANMLAVLVFLLACLSSYLNPVKWWFIAFLGLAFPYFLLIIFLFTAVWAFFKSRWIFLNLAALLLAWGNIKAVFAFHPFPAKFNKIKNHGALRVLQWNCMSFGGYVKDKSAASALRDKMLQYLRESNADVLCLQEFFDAYDPAFHQNLQEVSEKLGYPNYYYSRDYKRYKYVPGKPSEPIGFWGSIIFSRLPLADSGKIAYPPDGANSESLIYADVVLNEDTIRVMTTHLQSVKFGGKEYAGLEKIKSASEDALKASRGIFSKIKRSYRNRSAQARIIHDAVGKSPYPVILTGDFNDVPNSYTYTTIKKGLNDVFLKKGFGIGRTFSAISPTLRIDYMLCSKNVYPLQYRKDNLHLSDHFPMVADFEP
ncbi:MAG: endonuclease/exonuclease/phosphatase family protein, partial [Dinghuibacter sp.]|nr:endonuclease/exonuclease/phosphatase family protein [Dinghuibacter sp.]